VGYLPVDGKGDGAEKCARYENDKDGFELPQIKSNYGK
jgi:hypothetical protein